MTTTTIRQILAGRPLHKVAPGASVAEVAAVMAQAGVGAVAVLDGERLVGLVSERDVVFRLVAEGRSPSETCACEIMTAEPVTLSIEEPVSGALAAKLGEAFRHLPVVEGETVVGLLSYRDIPAEYVMLYERFLEMSTARADEQ
ncbi:MAG: signal transduction protein [Rhodobacterales bacterium]|nr:MAG: signal transduction protein [Rhodobacterales bacterium]